MEEIKIVFFALASFFGIEDGRIFADKTLVTVNPANKEIEIIQEGLFSIIHTENDSKLALEEWGKILDLKNSSNAKWSKELDGFKIKRLDLLPTKDTIQPHLTLTYSNERDLRALGIWYDPESNQFSVNNIPQHHIQTKNGKLTGNYWDFSGDTSFTFTIEPFVEMPENYQNLKIQLEKLVIANQKE